MRQFLLHISLIGLLAAGTAPSTLASDFFPFFGEAQTTGWSEAADWDTDNDGASTTIELASGWGPDTTCAPAACLNVATSVATEGGSASTQSAVNLFGTGGSQMVFPALIGQLVANSNADVTDIGIISDAETDANALVGLAVGTGTLAALTGSCTGNVTGATVTTWCVVAVVDENLDLVAIAGTNCAGECGEPFFRLFAMEAGKPYYLYAAVLSDTEAQTNSSGAGQMSMVFALIDTTP